METIAYCVISLLVGVIYGWKLREIHARVVTKRILQELGELEETEKSEDLIHIKIEEDNGMFYVYAKEDNQFMGQGTTKEELETVLAKRFPGKRFACSEKTLKEIGFAS